MAGGRPKAPLVLTEEERTELQRLARRAKTAQALAFRCKIILSCAEGLTNSQVAQQHKTTNSTVGKWRRRFVEDRLRGLSDEPRSGAPRKISDEQIEQVIVQTLEAKPQAKTQWSTRSMAKERGLSQSTISRIWRAFNLQPHREETFKVSEDPFFIEKVRDVVGLYMNPPEHALVLSVDEKSQAQALDRTQPLLPMTPGTPERRTHDYYRHGTTSLFAALDVATGQVYGQCHRQHRQQEFLKFLNHLHRTVPRQEGQEIRLIVDNYGTHKTASVKQWLARHPEYHLHFIPTSSSWLNQVERFFAEITNQCIRRGVFKSVAALERAILEYLEEHNRDPKPFVWTADADTILERVANVCKRISDSGH